MPPKKKAAAAKKKTPTVEMTAAQQDAHIEALLEAKRIEHSVLVNLKTQGFEIDRSHSNLHLPLLHAVLRRANLRKTEAVLAAGADPTVKDSLVVPEAKEDPKKKKKKAEPAKKKKESTAAVSEDLYATLVTKRVEEEDAGNALHVAVSLNNPEIVARILGHAKGQDLLAVKNLRGLTPLALAVLLGHTRIARQILATIDLNTSEVDTRGRSILFHAVAMCHVDLVALLLPSFASTLEAALTDRQGVRAVSLVMNCPSDVACATLLALERGTRGSVIGKFSAEAFEVALKVGNAELGKLALAGNPNITDKHVRLMEAALAAKSAASSRALADLLLSGKMEAATKTALLEILERPLAADGRDHGEARARVAAELRTRLAVESS